MFGYIKVSLLLLATLFLFGCPGYRATSAKCRKKCSAIQYNNVGSNFMWRNIDLTYGKCTCTSRSGKEVYFYMNNR